MRLFLSLGSLLALVGSTYADSGGAGGLYPPGLLPLINRANAHLSAGQFSEAAKIYTEAIEQSPADYLLYYKRATAYFSMSRHPSALEDFDKVLSLTSDSFENAHLMRAKILTKEGKFEQARSALQKYTKGIAAAKKDDKAGKSLLAQITEAESSTKKAKQAQKSQLWTVCSETASQVLKVASHSVEIRELRSECSLEAGDVEGAVGDLTRLTHISTPSQTSLMRLFTLAYFSLPPSLTPSSSSDPALSALKSCLHSDPDSPACFAAHKSYKALSRLFTQLDTLSSSSDWRALKKLLLGPGKSEGLLMKWDQAQTKYAPETVKTSPRRKIIVRALCKTHVGLEDVAGAKKWCVSELADMLSAAKTQSSGGEGEAAGPEADVDVLLARALVATKDEEFEEAVRVLEKAFEAGGRSDREVHAKLQKAQKVLRQSRMKDYYKVLGVARDADDRTIKKAFRRAARTAHPDKGGSEAKMAAVNEAYETLIDPELRRRYDSGDDPNDPMSGQGGGGNPFGGGFPGGGFPGGGFQFRSGGDPFGQFFGGGGGGGGGHHGGFQFNFGGH